MRPLCERGNDSISEQPESSQCSAARQAELVVWLRDPRQVFLFRSAMSSTTPPSASTCLSTAQLPPHSSTISPPCHQVLLLLAFLECSCKAYCVYAQNRSRVNEFHHSHIGPAASLAFGGAEQLLHSDCCCANSGSHPPLHPLLMATLSPVVWLRRD